MSGFRSEAFVERWRTMSLVEQLGNVGSEVERALSWKRKGNSDLSANALERSLDLLDLTLNDPRWRRGKRKEIARVREFLCDLFLGENTYDMSEESFIRYFHVFAFAARRNV